LQQKGAEQSGALLFLNIARARACLPVFVAVQRCGLGT